MPGRPTYLDYKRARAIALAVVADEGCLDIFSPVCLFSFLPPCLGYRLKYCLKGPLNLKRPAKCQHLRKRSVLSRSVDIDSQVLHHCCFLRMDFEHGLQNTFVTLTFTLQCHGLIVFIVSSRTSVCFFFFSAIRTSVIQRSILFVFNYHCLVTFLFYFRLFGFIFDSFFFMIRSLHVMYLSKEMLHSRLLPLICESTGCFDIAICIYYVFGTICLTKACPSLLAAGVFVSQLRMFMEL